MTDTQLYLAIGLPSFVALVGILVNVGYFVVVNARLGRVEDKIDPSVAEAKKTLQADISILRSEVKSNLSDMKETLGTVRADVKSSIGEAKETLRAEMGALRADFKTELEATRADARLMHAEVMAAIDRLDTKVETKLLVHELEHHRK